MGPRTLQSLAAALLCLAYALSALAGPATLPREKACQEVAEAYCRAFSTCSRACPTCDDPRGATCLRVELAYCSAKSTSSSARPIRETVDAASTESCLADAARSRDVASCHELADEAPRQGCGYFYAQARGEDYRAEAGRECGPEHHRTGEWCLLTCSSDADCSRFESCDVTRSCVARRRGDSK